MAPNKFTTFVHRNTNKMTLILIYTILEWILIILLLLNSLFSYLIIKFAAYFGLKTPCPMCTKLDHVFEPEKEDKFYTELLCKTHSKNISKLGFCSIHKKLAVAENLCGECSFTEREKIDGICELGFECSCCGLSLEIYNYSSCSVIKPSLEILGYTDNQIEIADYLEGESFGYSMDRCQIQEGIENKDQNQIISEGNCEEEQKKFVSGGNIEREDSNLMIKDPSFANNLAQIQEGLEKKDQIQIISEGNCEEEQKNSVLGGKIEAEDSSLMIKDPSFADNLDQIKDKKDVYSEIFSQHLDFFVSHGGYRLIPVELIDSTTRENGSKDKRDEECDMFEDNFDFQIKFEEGCGMYEIKEGDKESEFWGVYNENEEKGREKEFNVLAANEEEQNAVTEAEAEVSIGTEIPDLELTNEIQNQENLPINSPLNEGFSTIFANFHENKINGVKQSEEEPKELNTISVDVIHNATNKMSSGSELSDIEEDKIPDTPTAVDSLHQLHRKLLMLEKREPMAEESLDGSVASELECSEGVSTIDQLKSALKAERNALQTSYAELEEERSASAIAANQTMSMITRLQEEKAAMQMEALQYQRMMEEQSEYDQEALQLLNELMVKREKENQELVRELEVYRKKVLEYERKKFRVSRKSRAESLKSQSFSGSSSNNEDSEGLSIDLDREAKEEDDFEHENENHNTPVDEVLDLEESLGNFEQERISILGQLRDLEEKLFTISDDDEEHFENKNPIEHFYEQNGKHLDGLQDGFHGKTNGNIHSEGRIKGVKGKRLLPLFDEMSDENEKRIDNGNINGYQIHEMENSSFENDESQKKRNGIEEEVDLVYERLQALEEDREFLKHCISSLKKGDKGMDLLQEILQHLRDLRHLSIQEKIDHALVDDKHPQY